MPKVTREPVVRMVGRAAFTAGITVGNNTDSLVLNDLISTPLSTMSDIYGLYRFTQVKLTLLPGCQVNSATAPAAFGVGFTPEALLTIPTTYAEVVTMPYFCAQSFYITTGSNVIGWGSTCETSFNVPRAALMKTGVKWFRTQGKGTETDWESQGTFVFGCQVTPATSTMQFRGYLDYTCEFTDQLPIAVTREKMRCQVAAEVAESLRQKLNLDAEKKTESSPIRGNGAPAP